MKLAKGLLITALAFATLPAQAGQKEDLAKVRELAKQLISGKDVRFKASAYNNTEGNPCAEEGITYIVTVELRKSVISQRPDGSVGQDRNWEEWNQYYVSKGDLDAGKGLTDTLCQE